jgi:hypothetical protein
VERHVKAPPHETIQEVLTKAPYPLPNAIAELVDNSLDANATRISIRIRRDAERATAIQVIDNGSGIPRDSFDDIMKFAWKSTHKASDIGMYGVGLKTAGLSQAKILRVYSKTANNAPEGRQWIKSDLRNQLLGILSREDVAARYRSVNRLSNSVPLEPSGTIVELEEVDDFEKSLGNPEKYIKDTTKDIDSHLGLVFHRFLERRGAQKVTMFLETEQEGQLVGKYEITAVNPFDYNVSGARGWPKKFSIEVPTPNKQVRRDRIDAVAHIWPKRSKLPGFMIRRPGGKTSALESQGLFWYLNDRIVGAGGWSTLRTAESHHSLARMQIELTPETKNLVEIAYTKDSVKTPLSVVEAIRAATAADGTTFQEWVNEAEEVSRAQDDREPRLKELPVPGSWLRASARTAIMKSEFPKGETVKLDWGRIGSNAVFKVDRRRKRIVLNKSMKPRMDQILGSSSRYETFNLLLLMALRDHFGERKSKKLTEFEKVLNDTLMALFK